MRHRATTVAIIPAAASAAVVLALTAACRAERLPEPTGPYPVGATSFQLVDPTRDDPQTAQQDHKRRFTLRIWYPAKTGAPGNPAPWIPPDQLPHEETGFVGMMLRRSSHPAAKDVHKVLTSVVVHAREDVPPADSPKRFPVLLFAAGSQQVPSEYSSLTEDLASHGFVVIGYGPTVMGARTWRDDLTQVLDQLSAWNTTPTHPLSRRLDLDRIGAFGHSFGASALSILAAYDKRLKAIVLIDGGGRPEDARPIPALILNSTNANLAPKPPDPQADIVRNLYLKWSNPGTHVSVRGAVHMSFTDMALIPPFHLPGDGNAFIASTRAVLTAFFAQSLSGTPSPLLESGSPAHPLLQIDHP